MVAVRTNGGVCGAVGWAAGVIVNDGLIAEIDDVERSVRTRADLDGAEPKVAAADELRFLATGFLGGRVGDAVGLHMELADDVEGRLGGEVGIVPLVRPSAAFVDHASGTGGIATDLIDLHVGLLLPVHGGICGCTIEEAVGADHARELAFGKDRLRQDDVNEGIACGGLGVEHFAIGGHFETPSVAAARGVLLKSRAVWFETDNAHANGTEAL